MSTVDAGTLAVRFGVAILLTIVCVPLLVVYGYLLLWWFPAVAGPGTDPCDPALDGLGACWRPEQRTSWIAALALGLPGAVCFVMSLTRRREARRWWPWPVATALLLIACGRALSRIP